eukprot:8994259-Pyramimonas_sp.AAC.1
MRNRQPPIHETTGDERLGYVSNVVMEEVASCLPAGPEWPTPFGHTPKTMPLLAQLTRWLAIALAPI